MRNVNVIDRTFTWGNEAYPYKLANYNVSTFYYGGKIDINYIINCMWDKEDFENAIVIWEILNRCPKEFTDFKNNLDKYLNEAVIKSIIE